MDIENIIGYAFKNSELLKTALTHRSIRQRESNQKLEFFGDSILGFLVAEYIYFTHPDYNEGQMTAVRSSVVSNKPLAEAVESLKLNEFLEIGKAEQNQGIRKNQKAEADLYEALLAAIYIDGGINAARQFVKTTLGELISATSVNPKKADDYKSQVNEFIYSHPNLNVRYTDLTDYDKQGQNSFKFGIFVDGELVSEGEGATKKDAKLEAAKQFITSLDK